MIKSMTGYASLSFEDDLMSMDVTVRSVNHRYLDLQIKIPQSFGEMETRLRDQARLHVVRGRVELVIALRRKKVPETKVDINMQLVEELVDELGRVRKKGLIDGQLTVGDFLRLPQVLTIRECRRESDELVSEHLNETLVPVVDNAFNQLDAMRSQEGKYLRSDLEEKLATFRLLVEQMASAAEEGRMVFEERMSTRVREISEGLQLDSTSLAQEVVRLASRSEISEELARLRGHIEHWNILTDAPEVCGRKLDFLTQEMNREVNTIASKAEGLNIPKLTIAAKAELEKLREQVQNVE